MSYQQPPRGDNGVIVLFVVVAVIIGFFGVVTSLVNNPQCGAGEVKMRSLSGYVCVKGHF